MIAAKCFASVYDPWFNMEKGTASILLEKSARSYNFTVIEEG